MAKRIVFTSKDKSAFETLHSAYHVTAKPSTPDEHRQSNRILDALEAISDELPEPVRGFADTFDAPRRRTLKEGEQSLFLEDREFATLKKAVSSLQSLPSLSRSIEAMWNILDAAQDVNIKDYAQQA